MGILQNPTLQKATDFFRPLPEETPCLGLALGRQEVGLMESLAMGGKTRVLSFEAHSLAEPLWSGKPRTESLAALVAVLAPFFKERKGYRTLQVSLPDAAAHWEVFELEKIPAAGPSLDQFLRWRFSPHGLEKAPLVFARQGLGEEKGKKLLLGVALEKNWLEWLQRTLEEAGARVSFLDMASRFRFNLFHETFLSQGPGGLVSLEKDYWTLLVWDGQARPRFQRSKWWRTPVEGPEDLPLEELALEVERTVRSYVHAGPDRSVETLSLLAPEAWMGPALEAFQKPTEGRVAGLAWEDPFEWGGPVPALLSPTLSATAVRQ